MKAEKKDIPVLLKLQQFDMDLFRAKKRFDDLPQRSQILSLRDKKQEIEGKRTQVEEMRRVVEHDITHIKDEDERLTTKQQELQQKIDAAQGDYRGVEALSKDLNGTAKRRATLEADLIPLQEKADRIAQVDAQVGDALATIAQQEAEVIAAFQKEGGALQNDIAKLTACREAAAADLDAELLAAYEKKAQRHGGVAVSLLDGSVCSVCRNTIDEGKLLQIKAERPLSECPSCKRLMVVLNA